MWFCPLGSQVQAHFFVTRRGLISRSPIVLAGIAGLQGSRAFAQNAQPSQPEFIEVKTSYGRVRGAKTAADLTTFKGIPYAGSVSGVNRFKAAPPLKPWTDVREALALGAPSPQPGRTARGNEPAPAEDCVDLNVWTPAADGRKRSVMFYSHGGGFTTGSGGTAYQDGGNLARTFDVVVVATNHRLGLMGYLYLGGFGNTPPTLFWGPGFENVDLSVYKSFRVVKESNQLELRLEI